MTAKADTLTSLYPDIQEPLTDKPRQKRAYRISHEFQDDKLAEILDVPISIVLERFLGAKRAGLAHSTLSYYRQQCEYFISWCDGNGMKLVSDLDVFALRGYHNELTTKQDHSDRSVGGIHAAWRPIRTMLKWYENETDKKFISQCYKVDVKVPKDKPKKGVSLEDFKKMWDVTRDLRDQTVLLVLLDTGVRASELLALDWKDINFGTLEAVVLKGKGDKQRMVIFSERTAKSLYRLYASQHHPDKRRAYDNDPEPDPVFRIDQVGVDRPLSFSGLQSLIKRTCSKAGIKRYGLHDFRRAFALEYLRGTEGDVISLQRLMGHTNLATTNKYLALDNTDLHKGHRRGSPVANVKF